MRLVGPNCLGVLNTAPGGPAERHVRAAPSAGGPHRASPRRAAPTALPRSTHADRRGLGLSSFVSMGNKADLSGNDFLRYWEQDDGTDVVLLYLESFGNPQRFGQIAGG